MASVHCCNFRKVQNGRAQHDTPRNKCTALRCTALKYSNRSMRFGTRLASLFLHPEHSHFCPRLKEKNVGSVSSSVIHWKVNKIIKRSLSRQENGRVIGQWLTCYYPCPRDPQGTPGAHYDVLTSEQLHSLLTFLVVCCRFWRGPQSPVWGQVYG